MRIRLLILFISLVLINFTVAQTVKFSDEIKENKYAKYMRTLGADETGNIYVLRSNISLDTDRDKSGFKNRVYFLQYLNTELKIIWEKELLTSFEDGHIADVQFNNGRVVVVGFLNDRKAKTYTFYIQALNDSGTWVGKPKEIDRFSASELDDDDRPGVINSQDELSMAFSYRKISVDKKYQIYQVLIMDTSFSIRYKKQIEIEASMESYVPISFLLSDQGSFFALGIHYSTDKKVKNQDEVYYELHGYNPVSGMVLHTQIRSDNKFLTDVGFSIDNANKRVIAAGFYSDKTTYSVAGVFYNSFTEDSLIQLSSKNSAFPDSYLQKFIGERKDGKNKELVNYSIDRLIVRRDGGVAILAESFNRAERSYWDYYMQTYIYHYYYHYGNIMILSINPSGEILWGNVVPKDQNSVDDGGYSSSYFGSVVNGKLISLYNKAIDDQSPVLMTTVDGIGAQKTDVLFKDNQRVEIIAKSAKQIDEDTILLPAYRGKKLFILKVVF
ncbi:MAG: hypothetical protein IPI10_03235 [Bacteroidetes bacterium]|nr:hypothetical protein [Bacteroidota bacterium]